VFGDAWEHVTESQVRDALGEVSRAVPNLSTRFLEDMALPLAGWLAQRARSGQVVAAFSGPPGSGKSTLVRVLTLLLPRLFQLSVAGFSLDDVYLTKAERSELARDVHPLFMTRGVPGTHDLALAHQLIDELARAMPARPVSVPKFDKLADDRAPRDQWERVAERVNVILLDGWFWGASAGDEASLAAPLNEREAREDPDARWRRRVRAELAGPYQALFARAEIHVQMLAPSWRTTVNWRLLQQLELLGSAGPASEELRQRNLDFLALFERVAGLPPAREPDVVVALDEQHQLDRLHGRVLSAR
jgi:D-glycerate 3-kinase